MNTGECLQIFISNGVVRMVAMQREGRDKGLIVIATFGAIGGFVTGTVFSSPVAFPLGFLAFGMIGMLLFAFVSS